MIIFDFDGTLANTHHLILKHYNAFVARHPWFNLMAADHDFQQGVRSMTMRQARKQLQIPIYKLMLILPLIKRSLLGSYSQDLFVDGMAGVLDYFHDQGQSLAILTSNHRESVERVLESHYQKFQIMIDNCVFCKGRMLKRLVKANPNEVHTYVSDAAADIVAANKAGINTVAVTWGLHNAELLESKKPTFLARSPMQLLDCLARLYPQRQPILIE